MRRSTSDVLFQSCVAKQRRTHLQRFFFVSPDPLRTHPTSEVNEVRLYVPSASIYSSLLLLSARTRKLSPRYEPFIGGFQGKEHYSIYGFITVTSSHQPSVEFRAFELEYGVFHLEALPESIY